MEEKIKRLHELMDELADASREAFPAFTRVSLSCDSNGYRAFSVVQWGEGEEVETTPRRVLFNQYRLNKDSEWEADGSAEQNAYYERNGVLLKDE